MNNDIDNIPDEFQEAQESESNEENNVVEEFFEPEIGCRNDYNTTFIPLSFILFLFLYCLFLIESGTLVLYNRNLTLVMWPVLRKFQIFRLISNYFIHYTFLHSLENIVLYFHITKFIEKDIGTFYTLIIILLLMVLSSLLFILFLLIFKILFQTTKYNFIEQYGMSPIIFGLGFLLAQMKSNKKWKVKCHFGLGIIEKKDFFIICVIYQLINSNVSLLGNLCGLLSGIIIYNGYFRFALPPFEWVDYTEKAIDIKGNERLKFFLGYTLCEEREEIEKNIREIRYYCSCIRSEKKKNINANENQSEQEEQNAQAENGENNNNNPEEIDIELSNI